MKRFVEKEVIKNRNRQRTRVSGMNKSENKFCLLYDTICTFAQSVWHREKVKSNAYMGIMRMLYI